MTQLDVLVHIRKAMQILGESFSDSEALEVKGIYSQWQELCDCGYHAEKAGKRFLYGDDLYKTKLDNFTFQSQWIPGVGTESIYERIDVTHSGSLNDPIPYAGNMELFSGKYYTQNGVLYLCIRDTEAAVYHDLSALVGLYVEVVQ